MAPNIDVLLSPAEYEARQPRGFAGSVCVVFDVLRATSVIVTGLAHGAKCFVPVAEIPEALARKAENPAVVLAGERNGLRIRGAGAAQIDFELGNSPREYFPTRVQDREIVSTTTNGTRALRAVASANAIAAGSFLNLRATAAWLQALQPGWINLICAGTGDQAGLEDILGAGALLELLGKFAPDQHLTDAAQLALCAYQQTAGNLLGAVGSGQNGRRLLMNPELRDDVAFCLRRDVFDLVAEMQRDGRIIARTGGR